MKKMALVIGNSDYGDSNKVSGVEDAKAIADCLERQLGFEVLQRVLDGDLKKVADALDDFGKKIKEADVVVFFYSGHGFQAGGKNYLLPPGGLVSTAGALLLDDILQVLGMARSSAVKFAFLDACRNEVLLPSGSPTGLTDPPGAPVGVLQAFAASPGQLAASGSAGTRSPYTNVLLRYLPQPGLELPELFTKVGMDTFAESPQQQQPIIAGALPQGFLFRPAVKVHAVVPDTPSDDLLAILNGDIVLNTTSRIEADFTLRASEDGHDNELLLLVSKGKTYRNNHDWDKPEGWKYQLDLVLPDGTMQTFESHEDVPFKNGPHHGTVFEVARIGIRVDPATAATSVTARDTDIWNREAPFWARDQDVLFQTSIADLNLTPEDILSGAVDLGGFAPILRPFIVEFLKSGTVLGQTIADPKNTFLTVRGNKALQSFVVTAMTQGRADRIKDLKASIAELFKRNPRPFDLFEHGLIAAVQAAAQGSGISPDDIRVSTSLEDRSQGSSAAPIGSGTTPVPVP